MCLFTNCLPTKVYDLVIHHVFRFGLTFHYKEEHFFIGVSSELAAYAGGENRHSLGCWPTWDIGGFRPIQEGLQEVGVELTG